MELRERPFSAKLKIALFHSIITIMDGDIEAYSIRIPHISNQPADNNRNWQFLHDKDALRWRRDRHMFNFLSLRWRHKLRQFFCQYHNKSVSCSGHFDSILTVPMWYRTQQLFIQVSHHIIIIIVEVYSAPVFNSEFSTTRRATGMDESIFLFSSLSWRRMKDEVYIFNAHEKCTNVCCKWDSTVCCCCSTIFNAFNTNEKFSYFVHFFFFSYILWLCVATSDPYREIDVKMF